MGASTCFNGMMGKVESLTAVADWRACVIVWPVEIFTLLIHCRV